eukprot:1982309-Amphidinium_carterae.1
MEGSVGFAFAWLFVLAGFGSGLCRLLSASWTRGLPIDGTWVDGVAAVGHGLHPQFVHHVQFAAPGIDAQPCWWAG